jgi:RNA-binding protein 39
VNTEFHIRNVRSSSPESALTPEERDARTVFIMQLSQRCRARDLEDFMSSVGKVRDVKLIVCNKTRRFKGIAYVEFKDLESVPLGMGLSGQKLLGVPIVIQPSQAEKNRVGMTYSDPLVRPEKGPMKLYIGSLHVNITEDMLRGIFEPFGRIQTIQLVKDNDTGRSKGYGYIIYYEAEDAKKSIEHLNGFELAGRAMKVGHVTESGVPMGPGAMDGDDDRAGYDLGATGRLALMAKLAEGTGLKVPEQAANALHMAGGGRDGRGPSVMAVAQLHQQQQAQQQMAAHAAAAASANNMNLPPIATQCFMLSNMFDPMNESDPNWDAEIREDVMEECNKHGGIHHIYVDKASTQGNVYVKCPTVPTAVAAVNALHGRWFAGKVITAAYVPVVNYHNLFPDSMGR